MVSSLPSEKIDKIEAGGYLQYSGFAPHALYAVRIELLTLHSLLRLERDGIFLTFTCPGTIQTTTTPVTITCEVVAGDNARLRIVNGNFFDPVEVRATARIQLNPPSPPHYHVNNDIPDWTLGIGIILIIFMAGAILVVCLKICKQCCCDSSVSVSNTVYSMELAAMPSRGSSSSLSMSSTSIEV